MSDYRSTTVKKKDIMDLPTNPMFDGLSDELKTWDKFLEVERELLKIMYSDHKHVKMSAFMKCKRCNAKVKQRNDKIREFGFKDYKQYLTWKRVIKLIKEHEQIKK